MQPPPTSPRWRECWRLAWPLILSNLSVPLLGMVDTAVVGRLPEAHHLAAVALGSTVAGVLYFLFGFLRMGTTALAAQALGAGDGLELRATLARGLLVAAGLGTALAASAPLTVAAAVLLFAPEPAARDGMAAYLAVRLLGAPAALATLALLGWFLGLQDARRPLALMLATNALNAALSVALVHGLGMAAGGVALATVLAEHAGLALALLLARRRWRELGGAPPRAAVLVGARLRRLFAVNRDLFLRSLLLEAVFLAVAALGSRQGEVTLAANAVLMTLFTAAAYGLDGFAHAVEALVGRAVGARSPDELRAAVRAGFGLAGALALLMSAAFALLGPALVDLLTTLPEVREAARRFLPYAALVPVVAVWAFLYDGVFFGATRTAALRDGMLLAALLFALAAAVLVPALGNHGLWLALLAFLAARGAILALAYGRSPGGGAVAFARG
jgi:multidrug resistance protein, MATE family